MELEHREPLLQRLLTQGTESGVLLDFIEGHPCELESKDELKPTNILRMVPPMAVRRPSRWLQDSFRLIEAQSMRGDSSETGKFSDRDSVTGHGTW